MMEDQEDNKAEVVPVMMAIGWNEYGDIVGKAKYRAHEVEMQKKDAAKTGSDHILP